MGHKVALHNYLMIIIRMQTLKMEVELLLKDYGKALESGLTELFFMVL